MIRLYRVERVMAVIALFPMVLSDEHTDQDLTEVEQDSRIVLI